MTQRVAGVVLLLTGGLAFLGSFFWWASCPTTPCGGILMSISDYAGIDLGFGWISAAGGFALVVIGLITLIRPHAYELAGVAAFAAVAIMAATVAAIVWMYVIPGADKEFYWPPVTAMVIAILGRIALGASRFLRGSQISGNSPT